MRCPDRHILPEGLLMAMPWRAGRFFFGLVLGLALITWIGSVVVDRTTRAWFERDITLRAHLAANGARQAVLANWSSGAAGELEHVLADLTRDERVMAAAACGPDLSLRASTPSFPAEFSCGAVGATRSSLRGCSRRRMASLGGRGRRLPGVAFRSMPFR